MTNNNRKPLAAATNAGMSHGLGTPLLRVQLHRWPPPHLSLGEAKKLHLQLVDELRRALDPVYIKGPTCGYKAHQQVTARSTSETQNDTNVNCWLDSTTIRACVVDGKESVCRVDHYICDDGSWYDVVIPLTVEAANGEATNGIQTQMNGPQKSRTGAGRRSAPRQHGRNE